MTYTEYDTNGNKVYRHRGLCPGSSPASQSRTSYHLYNGQSVTLGSVDDSCTTRLLRRAPVRDHRPNGVVTQLAYDSAGHVTSSSTPDGTRVGDRHHHLHYDTDGEQTSTVAPDGNLSGANTGNYDHDHFTTPTERRPR